MKIVRRIGVPPTARGSSLGTGQCPDIFELEDGRYAVVGTLLMPSEVAALDLPDDASVASYEEVVVISRATLIRARADIPEE